MIFNFRGAFEIIFKSFDIAGDTKLIEKLEKDGVRFLMVIKRHWIYSIIHARRVLFVIVFGFVNVGLLVMEKTPYSIGIGIFLGINIIYWVSIIINYIVRFFKVQGSAPYIEDIYSCYKKSKESDLIFTQFFNQTVFLLIILIGIAIFTTIGGVLSVIDTKSQTFGIGIINSFLLLFQLGFFYGFLIKMMNLEMDFKIIVPGQILFYNQKGILGESKTMNSDKIKTINSKYSGFIGSFFNYGDVSILSEGDQQNLGEMTMDYIGNPAKTVKEIEKVLNRDLEAIERDVNVLLSKISLEIGISQITNPQDRERLKKYVLENNEHMQQIFEKGDIETKNEIRELYIIIQQ